MDGRIFPNCNDMKSSNVSVYSVVIGFRYLFEIPRCLCFMPITHSRRVCPDHDPA